MSDEEWVKAAMTDDSMVVELLVHLIHATPAKRDPPVLPLDWTVRQRRSKPMIHPRKPATTRASPTTPLSWSGATSLSGGGGAVDGFEESSRPPPPPKRPDASRSKVTATGETTTTKRSRKKKTVAELKEEEILLIKERRHLKRELATLRVNLEKQRTTNENLKRLKLDLHLQPLAQRVATVAPKEEISDEIQQNVASCDANPSFRPPNVAGDDSDTSQPHSSTKGSSEVCKEEMGQENKVMLPDLNLPLEEGTSGDVLCGIS